VEELRVTVYSQQVLSTLEGYIADQYCYFGIVYITFTLSRDPRCEYTTGGRIQRRVISIYIMLGVEYTHESDPHRSDLYSE
jgi:hypothetical protein